jgi:hypothetical protein
MNNPLYIYILQFGYVTILQLSFVQGQYYVALPSTSTRAPPPGYAAPSFSTRAPSSVYVAPSFSTRAPSSVYVAPSFSTRAPSSVYVAPSSVPSPYASQVNFISGAFPVSYNSTCPSFSLAGVNAGISYNIGNIIVPENTEMYYQINAYSRDSSNNFSYLRINWLKAGSTAREYFPQDAISCANKSGILSNNASSQTNWNLYFDCENTSARGWYAKL